KQHEIAGDRRLPCTGRLKVDWRRETHGRRHLNPVGRHLLRARHADLIDATVHLPVVAEDLRDLRRVDAEGAGGWRRRGRRKRRRAECERGVERRGEPHRRAAPRDVHVQYARCFMQQVVVQGGLRDPAFLELAQHRCDFALEQHQIPHHHRLGIAHLLERDPGAEGQRGLDRHAGGGDVQVTARQPRSVRRIGIEGYGDAHRRLRNPRPWRTDRRACRGVHATAPAAPNAKVGWPSSCTVRLPARSEWPMVHREAPPLVAVRWLRLAPLLAVCSCNDGPASPLNESQALAVATFGLAPGVVVYAAGASGDVAPIRTIAGANTVLSNATGIARDAAGNLYVTNPPLTPPSGGSVTVYAPGAVGNAAPIRTIAGEGTGLDHPVGVALDTAGNVYVPNTYTVTGYPPGASGNVAPIRTIESSSQVAGIALDDAGHLYVTNAGGYLANAGSVKVYAAGASGNAIPIRTIAGCHTAIGYPWGPRGVALDAAGNLYVAAHIPAFGITVYAATATGNVAPIRTISGVHTRLVFPTGIAVDAGDRLYVANEGQNGNYASVTVYAPGATGDATPTAMITGSFLTGPSYPQGIAVDAGGRLYIADSVYPAGKIRVYAPHSTGKFAPTATIEGGD